MGVKEEETGNVVSGPAVMGTPWWLISNAAGTPIFHLRAASWFEAREVGRQIMGETVSAELKRELK